MSMTPQKLNMISMGEIPADPIKLGLTPELVKSLPKQLPLLFKPFIECFQTRTHNNYEYAFDYIEGQICLIQDRTFKNIARHIYSLEDDGQNIQHFVSDSPWDHSKVFKMIRRILSGQVGLKNGTIIIDDTSTVRKGKSAGLGRQYVGSQGSVNLCQNGVGLVYSKDSFRTFIDWELFMPKIWFEEEQRKRWKSLHIPDRLKFKSKVEIALDMLNDNVPSKQ